MRFEIKHCTFALVILLGLVLTACQGTIANPPGILLGSPTVVGSLTTEQLDAISTQYGLLALAGTAQCNVTMAQINYQTTGVQPGEITNASGAVLIPGGANCPGPFPLVAFARGTNLFKSHTNADLTDPTADFLMTFLAAQGYAVVATDYLGYALSKYPYHPYMHADTEASAVIDSIRAARLAASSLGLTLDGKVMVSGYSQGGHSAMATQRAIERDNTGEFNLVAAAHLAGPYYVSAALIDGARNPIAGVQEFVPFQITAFQKIYGNVYSQTPEIFNAPYDGYIQNLLPALLDPAMLTSVLPVGTPLEAQHAMFKPASVADLANNPKNPTIVAAQKQDLLGWNPQAPTVLCGSSGDPTVKFSVNAVALDNDFKSRGVSSVTLVDVASEIQQKYGSMDPTTFFSDYHGMLEPPFCIQVARQLFDQHK